MLALWGGWGADWPVGMGVGGWECMAAIAVTHKQDLPSLEPWSREGWMHACSVACQGNLLECIDDRGSNDVLSLSACVGNTDIAP
eukprot:1140505-Pelagomonas_calceolata.AAC.1